MWTVFLVGSVGVESIACQCTACDRVSLTVCSVLLSLFVPGALSPVALASHAPAPHPSLRVKERQSAPRLQLLTRPPQESSLQWYRGFPDTTGASLVCSGQPLCFCFVSSSVAHTDQPHKNFHHRVHSILCCRENSKGSTCCDSVHLVVSPKMLLRRAWPSQSRMP